MPDLPSAASVAMLAAAALSGWLFERVRLRGTRRRLRDSTHDRQLALRQNRGAMREFGLASQELRGVGLSLVGIADDLHANDPLQSSAIRASAGAVLDLADTMRADAAPRALREERLALRGLLDEAIAGVAAAIGAGRRQWRIGAGLDGLMLQGDRRALRHVLSRVLADAVRSTRQDDWIDVSLYQAPDMTGLVIADEGAGTATTQPGYATPRDSRGLGLRLAIARALMEAHGGMLDVEARSGVGTQVTLAFPASRLSGG